LNNRRRRRPVAPAALAEGVPQPAESPWADQAEMVRSRMGRHAMGASERPPSPHQPAPVWDEAAVKVAIASEAKKQR
jgi:hypothetical protein